MTSHVKYVGCFVPGCTNNNKSTPEKLLFNVPTGELRKKWLAAVQTSSNLSLTSNRKCCEDHFNVEEDVENWMQYKLMKAAGIGTCKVKLKEGVLPHIFDCHPSRKSTHTKPEGGATQELERRRIVNDLLEAGPSSEFSSNQPKKYVTEAGSQISQPAQQSSSTEDLVVLEKTDLQFSQSKEDVAEANFQISHPVGRFNSTVDLAVAKKSDSQFSKSKEDVTGANLQISQPVLQCSSMEDHAVVEKIDSQFSQLFSSDSTDNIIIVIDNDESMVEQLSQQIEWQCSLETHDDQPADIGGLYDNAQLAESIEPSTGNVIIQSEIERVPQFSELNAMEIPPKPIRSIPQKRKRLEDDKEIYVYYGQDSSTSNESQQIVGESQKSCTPDQDYEIKYQMTQAQEVNMKLMENNLRTYLGVPVETKELIRFLEKYTKLPRLDIFIALRKIRMDETCEILGHVFGLDKPTISKKINFAVPLLAEYLKEYVYWPEEKVIQSHVPNAFRSRYSRVCCIVDCLEIEIQKPSNPVHQAETFSSYKHTNTVKYLIACTPNGLVSFISKGFGGRTSDTMVVKESGIIDVLPRGSQIMSDRGFKHINRFLKQKDCSLVRPPSTEGDDPMTTEEVRESKIIASLRIHVERVIRRLREFSFLRPHSCVNHEQLSIIDSSVVIAAGLINFQSSIVAD